MSENSDREVEVRGQGGYSPGVLDRAKAMLIALLDEAEADGGRYRFDVDGPCEALKHHTLPFLQVQPSAQIPIMIVVQLKSTGKPEGAIKGSLRLPVGANRAQILKEMAPALENFNKAGWKDVLNSVPPGQPPAKVVSPTGQINGLVPPGNALVPIPGLSNGHDTKDAPPEAPAKAQPDKHEQCVIRLLAGKEDGVFSGKDIPSVARQFFPGKSDRWYSTGIVQEFLGKRLVRRVASGTYQVEASFVTKRGILGLKLVPQPALSRQARSSKEAPRSKGTVVGSYAELIAQRRAIDEQLLALRPGLEADVVLARHELAEAEQGVALAKQKLASKLSALEAYDRYVVEPNAQRRSAPL